MGFSQKLYMYVDDIENYLTLNEYGEASMVFYDANKSKHNAMSGNATTIKDYCKETDQDMYIRWVSDSEKKEAIRDNKMWTVEKVDAYGRIIFYNSRNLEPLLAYLKGI